MMQMFAVLFVICNMAPVTALHFGTRWEQGIGSGPIQTRVTSVPGSICPHRVGWILCDLSHANSFYEYKVVLSCLIVLCVKVVPSACQDLLVRRWRRSWYSPGEW